MSSHRQRRKTPALIIVSVAQSTQLLESSDLVRRLVTTHTETVVARYHIPAVDAPKSVRYRQLVSRSYSSPRAFELNNEVYACRRSGGNCRVGIQRGCICLPRRPTGEGACDSFARCYGRRGVRTRRRIIPEGELPTLRGDALQGAQYLRHAQRV